MKKTVFRIAAASLIAGILSIASAMSFEDEQAEHQHYCEMVKNGACGKYKGGCDE